MTANKRKTAYILGIALMVVVIIAAVVIGLSGRGSPQVAEVAPAPTPEVIVREREVEKIVYEEKTITADMVREGLRDLGELVTQEYYFTEVIDYSKAKKIDLDLKIFAVNGKLPFSESRFLISYDGVIAAGIDFTRISVRKDDEQSTVVVSLPPARILYTDVDPESFQLYDEKNSLLNPLSVSEYNEALLDLENNAAAKAIDRGLLEKADQNAENVVRNFIAGMLGSEFSIQVVRAG